jgi:acetoin utilization deacetylase AcuC-like enzyme
VQIFHDPSCAEYGRPGHPERPERIVRTVPLLKSRHGDWQWHGPRAAFDQELLRAHSHEHLARIAKASQDFDLDTPAYSKIDFYARQSAGAAIEAACAAIGGKRAFSLMRPPGHHAMRDRAMGFCYFSNIAVATLNALAGVGVTNAGPGPTTTSAKKIGRIAIWDFDAHHGNGTEALVAHNERIMFASIHQYPGWPGTGTKSFANVLNFPIAPYSSRSNHVRAAEQALEKLLEFKPQLLLVSAGFDAYKNDPITQMTLERGDFATFGKWLTDVKIPTAAILEGGYSDDLPELIDAFLGSWDS